MPSNRLTNMEVWPKKEVNHLVNLIKRYNKSVVLISGDVHHG